MTRKEAKRRAELYSALAEGKIIQFNQENGEWIDLTMELIEVLSESAFRYRIKPEPKYRPFNSQEECWNEMLKHQPFGWLRIKDTDEYCDMTKIFDYSGEAKMSVSAGVFTLPQSFEHFVFVDGTPFGIKEE